MTKNEPANAGKNTDIPIEPATGSPKPGELPQDGKTPKPPTTPEPKTPNPITDAKDVLEKITEQNKLMEENIKKQERMIADNLLNGNTLAGKETTQDQKEIHAARELLGNTGYADELFPK